MFFDKTCSHDVGLNTSVNIYVWVTSSGSVLTRLNVKLTHFILFSIKKFAAIKHETRD